MDIKDIKVGETYNVRVIVKYIEGYDVVAATIGQDGKEGYRTRYLFGDNKAFSPISPETAPKYDPNREFRVGDKVGVRKVHGKLPQCRYNGMVKVKEGDCCTIHEKEHRNCYWVTIPSGGNWCFDAAYLELLTSVEEMERYYIEHDTTGFAIVDRLNVGYVAHFKAVQHPHAKEAAEAERDRLNEEFGKEMGNV